MTSPTLGKLESVDLRQAWQSEASDFTPWLAEAGNLAALANALGLDLELQAQEQNVGPFRADLLCKNTLTGNWVLIENQLERTDHSHLGQLLTYAAGLEAETIVWVAARFDDEHRAALDWLNEITSDRFNFFGVQIELWRIDGSHPAPRFNIVAKPNGWAKSVQSGANASTPTPTQELQRDFWTDFKRFMEDAGSPIRCPKPLPQNWMPMAIGRTGFNLAAVASTWDSEAEAYDGGELRAELVMNDADAKGFFRALEDSKQSIEDELGFHVTWHNPPATKQTKIYARRSASLEDRAHWPEYFGWLRDHLERFQKVFAPRVRGLVPAKSTSDGLS